MAHATDTSATQRVVLPPDDLQARLIAFVDTSALSYCTRVVTEHDGTATVTASWDAESFSSGEKVLWKLLQSATSGDLRDVAETVDAANAGAVLALVSALLHVGRPR